MAFLVHSFFPEVYNIITTPMNPANAAPETPKAAVFAAPPAVDVAVGRFTSVNPLADMMLTSAV
jgi:hypothetical protein